MSTEEKGMEKEGNEKYRTGFACNVCGTLYDTKEEAEQCWDSHVYMTLDYVNVLGQEMPAEVIVKKHEGGWVIRIASYSLKEVKEVKMREK